LLMPNTKNILIPEDKITDIQNAADIVDVISEYVLLKKAGKNYKGLCPFHSEKTPSFTVSPDKKMFYCFGCHTGGNVFSFLMKHEGYSYPEAIKLLAERYGIELPTHEMSPEIRKQISEREALLSVNKEAKEYFCNALQSSAGKEARAYLNNRGVAREIIDIFQLGYAPDGWDNLLNFFLKKRISPEMLEKAGLIIPRQTGKGFYDRFRNRIIFPITDIHGQVIGFGGRVMDDSLPKYLNSPETPLYNKSRSLYGLNMTKRKCREEDKVFIVEGYFDLISLYQYGIQNAAATLGTALTPEHVRLLKGYANRIILVYDSDDAGIRAAHRSIEIFEKENTDAYIMTLPPGHDPDSFLFEHGAESFLRRSVDNSYSMIKFLMKSAIEKHGLSVEGKVKIISDMEKPIADVQDNIKRLLYIRDLAESTDLDQQEILKKIKGLSPTLQMPFRENNISGIHEEMYEEKIIAVMLHSNEILPDIRQHNILEHFMNHTLKSIGETILANPDKNAGEIADLMDKEKKRQIVISLAMQEEFPEYSRCLELIYQIEGVFSTGQKRREDALLKQIKAAENTKDDDFLMKLLVEKQKTAVSNHEHKMSVLGVKY